MSYIQTYALKNIQGEMPILNHGHAQPNAYKKPWAHRDKNRKCTAAKYKGRIPPDNTEIK